MATLKKNMLHGSLLPDRHSRLNPSHSRRAEHQPQLPGIGPAIQPSAPKTKQPRCFYGSAPLSDPNRLASRSKEITNAIVQHLTSLVGTNVRITIEISADIPDGAPEHVVRTVTENSRTLKFDQAGFEEKYVAII
ncbi:MAG: hypothetical protein WCF99_00430 [Chloroflexales bacterium]